jgi:hypothetical protein
MTSRREQIRRAQAARRRALALRVRADDAATLAAAAQRADRALAAATRADREALVAVQGHGSTFPMERRSGLYT